MELEVKSYEGLGPIRFGMNRDHIRRLMACDYSSTETSIAGGTSRFDHFMELGILVFFDAAENCIAIQVYEPSQVILEGQPLIGFPFDEIRPWFTQRDAMCEDEDTGLTSKKYGVCLYTGDAVRCPHDAIVHVFVFQRGYFD